MHLFLNTEHNLDPRAVELQHPIKHPSTSEHHVENAVERDGVSVFRVREEWTRLLKLLYRVPRSSVAETRVGVSFYSQQVAFMTQNENESCLQTVPVSNESEDKIARMV